MSWIFTLRSTGILVLCMVAGQVTSQTVTMSSQQRSTLQPSVTTTSPPTGSTDSDLFLPVWAIAVIAVAFGVTALFALIWWCLVCLNMLKKRMRKKKKKRRTTVTTGSPEITSDDDEAPMLDNEVIPASEVLKSKQDREESPDEPESLGEMKGDKEKEMSSLNADQRKDKKKHVTLSLDESENTNSTELQPLAPSLSQLLQDVPLLHAQYMSVSTNKPLVRDIPEGANEKNRYRDVLPNPHSRVVLSKIPGVKNSDYINANYIHGYLDTPQAYIAAQGPMTSTVNDFWRMIWEHKCSAIVMTTSLEERGRMKCARYWPERRDDYEFGQVCEEYGNLEVRLIKRRKMRSYTVTNFNVMDILSSKSHKVTHYWFTAWPDHGVPDTTGPLIDFILETRNAQRQAKSRAPAPLLVHCSAGIGRTGVFIGADIGMRELDEKGKVDPLEIFISMRQDRGGMVQTKEQYELLHKVLFDYGKRIGLMSDST